MSDSSQGPFGVGDLVTVHYRGENILEAVVVKVLPERSYNPYGIYTIVATKIFQDHIHLATKDWWIGARNEVGGEFLVPIHPLVQLARAVDDLCVQ